MATEKTDAGEKVVAFIQNLTGGNPAAIADVVGALQSNNLDTLMDKLNELKFPTEIEERRKWWGENWRTVRSFSLSELHNQVPKPD